jgi:hypothetical protein
VAARPHLDLTTPIDLICPFIYQGKNSHTQNYDTFLRRILRVFVHRRDIKPFQRPDVVQQYSPHSSQSEPKHVTKNNNVANQSGTIESPVDGQEDSPSNAESRIVTQADDPAPSLIDDSVCITLPVSMHPDFSHFVQHPSEVPDLTGQIMKTSLYPVFEGVYSNIFIGEWEGSKVISVYLFVFRLANT